MSIAPLPPAPHTFGNVNPVFPRDAHNEQIAFLMGLTQGISARLTNQEERITSLVGVVTALLARVQALEAQEHATLDEGIGDAMKRALDAHRRIVAQTQATGGQLHDHDTPTA